MARARLSPHEIVRHGVSAETTLAIVGDLLSPELRAEHFDDDLAALIRDVRGVARRPDSVTASSSVSHDERYTAAGLMLARVFVESSEAGRWGDPTLDTADLQTRTGLSLTEIEDATHELSEVLTDLHGRCYAPRDALFAEFDARWRDWDPAVDALRIAADLVNAGEPSVASETLLIRYDWPSVSQV